MSSEAQLIIDVWEGVRDHVAYAKRATIAQDILHAFVEYGFTAGECASIVDEDPDLAHAFENVFEDEDEENDDEEFI